MNAKFPPARRASADLFPDIQSAAAVLPAGDARVAAARAGVHLRISEEGGELTAGSAEAQVVLCKSDILMCERHEDREEVLHALVRAFDRARHKRQFVKALGLAMRDHMQLASTAARLLGIEQAKVPRYMRYAAQFLSFIACIETPPADAALKATPLQMWLATVENPAMQAQPLAPEWRNEAAVFSFLCCPDAMPATGAWNAVPCPDWLAQKRHQLSEADIGEIATHVAQATSMPQSMCRITADYAGVVRIWGECLAFLREASRQ